MSACVNVQECEGLGAQEVCLYCSVNEQARVSTCTHIRTCMSWGCIETRAVKVGVYTVWGSGSIFTLHVCEFTWEVVKGGD